MRILVGSAWLNDGSRSVGSADAKTRLLAFPSTGWFSVASFGAPWQSLTRLGWLSCSGWPRKAGSAWLNVVLQLGPRLPGPRALATGPGPPGPPAGAPGLGPGTPRRGPGPRTPSPQVRPSSRLVVQHGDGWVSLAQVGSAWLCRHGLRVPLSAGLGLLAIGHAWRNLVQLGSTWLSVSVRTSGRGAGAAPSPGAAAQPGPARIRSARAARVVTGKASALTRKLGPCRAQLGSAWLSLAQRRCADREAGGRQRAAYPAVWLNLVQHGLAWFSLLGLRVPP